MAQGMNAGTMTATLKAETSGFVANIRAAGKEMGSTAGKAGTLKTAVAGMAAGIAAFAAYKAMQALTQQFKESVSAAAQMQTALVGLQSITKAFGADTDKATEAAKSLASDGLMSIADASSGLQNLIATNFTLEESINLMRGLKDSSALARQGTLSIGEAVVGATQGLKNQNSIMVDNSGVTKNLSTILTEAGKSQNDLNKVTSDASVRAALYNGILNETKNFSDGAATSAQTYTGKTSALKTAMFNLHATIGKQLLPGMGVLVDMFTKNANETDENIKKSDTLARAFYSVANVGKAMFLVMKGGIQVLQGLGHLVIATGKFLLGLANTFIDAKNALFGFFKNIIFGGNAAAEAGNSLKGYADKAATVIGVLFGLAKAAYSAYSALKKGSEGDIGGAKAAFDDLTNAAGITQQSIDEFKGKVAANFAGVGSSIGAAGQAFLAAGGSFGEAGDAMKEAISQSNFKQLTVDIGGSEKAAGGLTAETGKASKTLEELRDKIMDVSGAFKDLRDKFAKTMEDFKKKIKEKKAEFQELKDSVKDLRKEVAAINKETEGQVLKINEAFAKSMDEAKVSFGGKVADEILKAEKSVGKFNETIQDLIEKRDSLKADDISKQVGVINNSLNDYATDAERAEAAERIAEMKKTAEEGLAVKRAEVDKEIAEQQRLRDEQQKFLTDNKAAYGEFSSFIAEARRQSGLDAIQILREGFQTQQQEIANQRNIDLQNAETEKQNKVNSLIERFNEENKARAKNLEDVNAFLKAEEKANAKAVNNIKKKRDGLLKGIEKDFQKSVDYLNKISGGAVQKAVGSTKADIDPKKGGTGANLQIGSINISSAQSIESVLAKISLLARVV